MSRIYIDADEAKACCATTYGSDVVALLLGDSYHPGGLALTRRLADRLRLAAGMRLLDVAAGRGTTAMALAAEYRVEVDGVDLAAANVNRATDTAAAVGRAGTVRFHHGDAERLPFADASYDAVVCECAFCTFPDKATAAAELTRVLRPGGRVGITDVTVDADRLPAELRTLAGWVACVADARSLGGYVDQLTAAGLLVHDTERHDSAVLSMVDQIEARLTLVCMTARTAAEALGVDFKQAGPVIAAARQAIADGIIGYALLIAERPA